MVMLVQQSKPEINAIKKVVNGNNSRKIFSRMFKELENLNVVHCKYL